MDSPKQTWQLETDDWLLVEYEKQPSMLTVSLNCLTPGEDSISLHFGSLGVDRSVLEIVDKDFLNRLLNLFSIVAIANDWNVSVSSFWANLPYCIPDPDDYDFEDENDRIFLEKVWEFIENVDSQKVEKVIEYREISWHQADDPIPDGWEYDHPDYNDDRAFFIRRIPKD